MANLAEKDYGSDPIMWADYRTPSSEYTGRSLGLKGIAEGYVDDPSVTQMRGMLGAAGRQQLGAARSADMASGAARGRLGRGAQQQTQLMAPGMLDALRAQTQQAAQQQQLGRVGYQRGQRQSQMEMRRNAEMAGVLGQESALAKGETADTAGMASGAVQGAGAGAAFGPLGAILGGLGGAALGYFAEEGGVVPGDKDEAVPVVAHGGELILSEDASKKLLKALAGKDKGTLQAFERDILENKGVLQSFERDAPQRDKAKKEKRLMTDDEMEARKRRRIQRGWHSEWNPMPPGTVGHDAYIRGDWDPNWSVASSEPPHGREAPPHLKIPEREQEYGPWEKGRPYAGGGLEESGPIHPTDKGPWPFHGRVLPGQGYMSAGEPGEFDYPPPRPSGHSTPPTRLAWWDEPKPLDPLSAVDRGYGWIERPKHILGPNPMLPSEKPFPRTATEERSDAARFEMGRDPRFEYPAQMTNALSDLDKRLSKDDEIIRQAVESVRGTR